VIVWFATVNVPVRAAPVFAAAVIETVPLPVPLAPAVIDSHDALLVAVQVHPAAAVIVTGPVAPPPATTDRVVGFTEYEQLFAPCVIVTVWPAIVSVPVRAGPLLAATAIVMLPFPVPLAPEAIEIHETLLCAVHAHPADAVTDTEDPVDPVAATEIVNGFAE